jgi:SAM-dependent methyltransferase
MKRFFIDILKWLLRLPADALVVSSKVLPGKIDARIDVRLTENPCIAAKFYPYPESGSYVLARTPANAKRHCGSEFAIPHSVDLQGSPTAEYYLNSGRRHVATLRSLVKASGYSFEEGYPILDFGCGNGRMIRWLSDLAEKCEVWGVDMTARYIDWCQQYLTPPFRFATTTSFPYLPFEDRYFGLIIAGSVFTHIADLSDAWLLELKRILRPGGRLYITVHDKHTIDILLGRELPDDWFKPLIVSDPKGHLVRSNFAVLTLNRAPGEGAEGQAQVFYDIDWLSQKWGRILDVLSVTQEARGYQTAILLGK